MEKVGVTPDVTFRITWARKSAGEIHSGFETHEEGHTKSKTGAISGSTKWALVQQKFKKKKIRYFKLNMELIGMQEHFYKSFHFTNCENSYSFDLPL